MARVVQYSCYMTSKGDRVRVLSDPHKRHARVTWLGTTKAKIVWFDAWAGMLSAIVPQTDLQRVDGRGYLVGAWNGPGALR